MALSDKNKKVILRNMGIDEEKQASSSTVARNVPKKETQTNWYKGSQPTETETLAQIYRLAQTDRKSAEEAFSFFQKAKSEGAWYNPYSHPTTSKLTQTSLANTQKAQAEWAQLSDELSYWARRTDRNYSDDEILARINWDNYKTLQKMDEGRESGSPLALNEAVGYSRDAMYGVLWAARNPGHSTGDAFMDAVQGVLGRGAAYERNEQTASRLDPTNAAYNPYAVSGTMDDLAFKYRTDRFDEQWLAENRDLLRDADTASDYTKIYNAVQNTSLLQAEAEALKTELKRYADRGVQPDYAYLLEQDEYKNLAKLSESLKSGKLIDTTDVINFDLQSLIAETDAAVKLKQNQLKAATDLEAATELAEEEKQGWLQKMLDGVANWWQNLTTPEETVVPPTPIIEETPAQIVSEGADMFEPVVAQHIAEGDYNAAADEAMQEYASLIEQNPELLTTDNMQKGALFLLVAANEAGWLTDPAAQEKANSVMATVEASMGVESESTENKTVWSVLYNLLTGGDLSDVQNNEGIGANATLMLLWDRAMARGVDLVENVVGMAISGVGELLDNEWLINYGKETAAYHDSTIAHYDRYLDDHGTPLENLVAKQGSELVHMAQLGGLSKAASAYKALKTGKLASFMTSVLMASPFAVEAGSSEMQDTYAETDDYSTSLAAGAAAFAITSLLSQWDGILKNIEVNGMPYLPEVVEALGSVPGSGAKAGIARWGKGFGMWMMNGLKTLVNEGAQEAAEGGATDIIVGLIKGENLSEMDWAAFGQERLADAVGGAFLSMGSAVSTMPTYARSVKVAESQMRKSDVTAKDVATFVSAMQADMQDPEIVKEMRERAQNIAVEARTGELIAEGVMPEVDTSALEAAQAKADESSRKVADANLKLQQAETTLQNANTKFNEDPTDKAAKSAVLAAASERTSAIRELEDARLEAATAQEDLVKVKAETEAQQEAALNTVREQARAEVAQNIAATQAMRAEQEVAAEAKRQSDNVLALEADEFVNTYFSDAPADAKKTVRERYMSYDGQTRNATRSMAEFAGQISKKFGLSVKFIDSHGVFEGAYAGGNQIVLDKNATQGDVIKRVLVHEITHAAETSKSYDALAEAVLDAYYGGNKEQIEADLNSKKAQYAEVGQDSDAAARSELVAERLAEMLSGNQEAMDRLVAEKPGVATRIWRALKEFIGKLTGVKNSELDKYIQLEKKLEKALKTRGEGGAGSQFLIERGEGGVDVVVVEEDILEGVSVRDWPKVVRGVMASRFPNGVPVGSNVIRINRDTRKEVTNSKDTMWLKHNDFSTYQDKLRATANSDEIIKASRDYVNEAPTHERKDRIVDFARGEVSMRIGGKEYDAEVVVGYDADGGMKLYDFVRMTRTDAKKAGQPFEDDTSRDSRAGLSGISVSENGSYVKEIASDNGEVAAEVIKGGATKFSLSSWTTEEKETVRTNLVNEGYEPESVDKWISDVDGVAAIIAADKDRLDYVAADNQVMLKDNQEYVRTLDASTLCAKRLLYQGTFNEIQHMLPNTVLSSEDLLHLSDMMNQAGLETPCGVCYVESRRRHLGKYAQEWLDGYKGGYKPTLDELTTTDGLENLRAQHPDEYKAFVSAMNAKGSANPKVVQLRTDYQGDIRGLTKGEIEKIIKIGGLRVQSFSDFETPHLIDMMQAVLDMSARNLPAQAYTKVPNFAWVFGDTGIKINLSLLAEGNGLNEDGTLKFSSKEGMDIDEALRLRDRYSENVGTILVGVSDEHIRAAMADPRIDYIIPFHKSGWGQNELKLLPVLNSYTDFTASQNERVVTGYYKNGKPKYGRPEGGNLYPIDYWDYSKTGDENAAIYLRLCEEDGRVPKFDQFLTKDADGHWVAPSGYWKMLIDFKMYNNDGVGAPQQAVQPNFNMEEAVRVLDDYEGGANELPVAWDIVDQFVAEKKSAAVPGTRFSLPSNDILDQRIAQHRNRQLAPASNDIIPDDGEQEQNYGSGERQFAGQTMQNSAVVPDWVKQEFLRPEELNYETDTNREQVERGWQRIQENGYEAERDRLLSLDRYSADDTAEANLMMAMALREDTADPATFMALASHYNKEGTKAGQELQARKLFTRMSPTSARVWAAGQMESRLEEHMRTHRPQRRQVDERAERVANEIRDMQSGDEVLRLNAGGDFTIDESNNRWGVPINEQQQALIDRYNLNNVRRPGVFYNRATTRQRMLEAIIATPNPLEVTGLGLNLIQRLEYMDAGVAVITNADLNYIGTQLGQFVAQGGDEGGREADLAVARAYEAYGNINPTTLRERLRTWRYVSMLLSVPSATRNVIGNAAQNAVNATAHGIAVELDKLASRVTGQRTVEHLSVQERIDGWRGFAGETRNTFRDYFVDRSVTQRGNDKYNTNQRGRIYQNQFIETMRNVEGFLMSFGDRNMWRKAYLNSLAEQQKLADRGLLFNDDGTTRTHEQMLDQAEADANYATFTEDNAVSNALSQMKNIPGVGEVIDFIMPFTGVPTNITRRMIQYSPIGLMGAAIRHGYRAATHQNFDQRAFVDGVSRGLTGTALLGVGILAAMAGVIKPGTGDEDDDKKYGLKTAMGGQYTPYVYNPLNDEYVSLAAFAPAASPLTMGLAAYEEFKNNEDVLQALINASFSGADQIFDASYMSGIQDIFKGYGSPAENITNAVFSNAVSQNVPALLTQLSNTIDPYVRDTKDKNAIMQALKSGLINRIPGLREQLLPVKIDVTGQSVRTKEGLRNFYDPFTTTDARKDPAVDELFRLSETLGSSAMLPSDALSGSKMTLTINKQKVTLDGKGKETYRKRYGELWLEGGETIDKKGRPVVVEGVRALIESAAYQMMDDEERADAIADILSEAKTGAAMEALEKYGAD